MGIRHQERALWQVAVLTVLASITVPLQAQDATMTSQTAEALFEQGKQLLDSNATEEACGRFAESQRLEPAVGTLGMLAWCHELQGKTASAWREYLATAELASKVGDRAREKAARERATSLQLRLSTIRVEVREPANGLIITLEGSTLNQSEWGKAIPVDPGQIPVSACAKGFQCWTSTTEVKGDAESAVVEIPPLKPVPVVRSTEPLLKPAPPPSPALPPSRNWLGPAIAGGVAVVGLGFGTYYGMRTISKTNASQAHCDASNACDPEGGRLRDEARTASIVSNVSFGAGLAAAAVGTVLWLRSSGQVREARPTPSLSIAPEVRPSAASVCVSGVF